ncbi:MAG: heterodisulfide reductase subunit A [Hydrogenophilales bacterium CG03_land_8_20_14_0_80_62_28]|nr:CoB--CoM heterodisulfide reductase iron-sulfur subunit A family protein [Betaproteobacteria bacterium]OIO78850.1 MAG: heterodisulfide reductase subunit A [Hydrogenophilaceae bacterium CG1_02_62_390]PIV22972.1 MAG: heterodisulfide reductase subunit A [Hydrogenophilales bacterium CG03_land_8_20_14_0_80_62_28]PIW38590.1 MAG: heterodisulfide reductase subunit A [Hydrogenophilales bacterium CG15_BIG_FIL_POST_REV_8_21_14_020_62_31]PIW72457.1 MAG: heterodisulfide reductase subunit A [Hydrogenophila
MTSVVATNQTILVVGGGIAGMTAALEAAETGKEVVLVEKNPYLGGRTVQLYRYFPKMCHPACGLEINLRRLKANPRIQVLTMAEVTGIAGDKGNYSVTVKLAPRFVNESCTACGECNKAASTEILDAFNYNLGKVKAAYLPSDMAYPQRYVIDPSVVGSAEGQAIKAACKYGAVDLDMKEEVVTLNAGAIVWATGWQPYDAEKITPYRYGEFKNVITNVEFERLADPHGPTGGKLLRPSDGKEAKNVAFIQCAGSRDENHLRHCSRFCCMASLKQTRYVQEAFGDAGKSTVYYIDIRAIDRFEDFYQEVKANPNVAFVKSKVARISEDKNGDPRLWGVNTEGYIRYSEPYDLVVLAVGMEPSVKNVAIPAEVLGDSSGFVMADPANAGIFGAGCATNALDVNRAVQSATAAALRAVQVVNQVARAEA